MTTGLILVVDDSLPSLRLLVDLLEAEGYQVRAANSGELALAFVTVKPPELILLDIRMPDIDGFEVLRRLKARQASRAIPVIFLSAAIEAGQRIEGFRLGAVDFVAKPFQREELLARVSTHLELFRLRARFERKAAELQQTNEQLLIAELAERKEAAEALARVNVELQRFSEVTAHHLQEPARRIASYAERLTRQLGDRLDDAETRLSLDFIGLEARRMKRLLGDVERYLAAAAPRGEIVTTDAGKAVARALDALSSRIDETGTLVSVGPLPQACIDAPRLTDLFHVALDNALRHGVAPASDVPLCIAIDGERNAGVVRYRISDNGPGIEAQYRERVFRVFERLSSRGENTGIGLAILRRIAQSCGGRAWIEETPGGGCCLLFELPAGENA
jgi:DNA-binding response OmpR family regulator